MSAPGGGREGRPLAHQQVDGQLDFLEAVNKLSLGRGPRPQCENALWNGGGVSPLACP